jgi:hypothetical protein
MTEIQALLNQEAKLSNEGKGDSEERQQILTMIRLMRIASDGSGEVPWCFGQDDCSTRTMTRCPWRIDCGT